MFITHRSDDWDIYRMDYGSPHRQIEPPEREATVVAGALGALREAGVLAHTRYDDARFLAHRRAVAENFEIPWTAITPRVQRLLYAISAIARPANMLAAGVFCGNTFISNAGAAVGPGACYSARNLVGIEIDTVEAARAERNVRRIDPTGTARVVAADAVDFVSSFGDEIHLLYLDADGDGGRGKSIYPEILEAGYGGMPQGAIVLAHNSVNCADDLTDYSAFVRDEANFAASVNVVIDGEGLEVSVK